jgi:DNA adenine methylase
MSYPGSKGASGTWQRIIGQMPPHQVYVEPFFGEGWVFWHKRPSTASVLIDRDEAVIARAKHWVYRKGLNHSTDCHTGDALARLGHGPNQLPSLRWADTLVYCDPPYLLETRKNRRYYRHEMTRDDHQRLLAILRSLECNVLVSHTPCDLYDAALQGWRCITYRTRWHNKTATECLWANFPEPEKLHDWRFAGRTFRERLTFRRLADRWLARLDGMAPRKRGFVLEAISERHGRRHGAATP